MAGDPAPPSLRRLTTPHSAALSGVVFAVLSATYLGAAVLLVVVSHKRVVVLVFPAWVLFVSLVHLRRARRGTAAELG